MREREREHQTLGGEGDGGCEVTIGRERERENY